MAHVRIRARGTVHDRIAASTRYPQLHGCVPSWADVDIMLVGDDGNETHLTGVESVTWTAKAGSEPCKAVLTFVDAEIDVEGELPTRPDLPAVK